MNNSKIFLLLTFILLINLQAIHSVQTKDLGEPHPCHYDKNSDKCIIDGYIGSKVIYEDNNVRIWNFTLAPGEMTSMHSHDNDYHFVSIAPSQLEVYGEAGDRLFDFRAEGVFGFKVEGAYLEPVGAKFPVKVPRVHSAKNIGNSTYYEILYETKKPKQNSEDL